MLTGGINDVHSPHREQQTAGLRTSIPKARKKEFNLTGWPRKAILRRAHKLGLPSRPVGSRRRWTMVEYRFAIESLNHLSVREIAEEIGRSEKAVWDMVGQRGIAARFQDGYTMRELAERLHLRRLSVQEWVEGGLLHRKRNGRIDEASLQSFFYTHPERLKWLPDCIPMQIIGRLRRRHKESHNIPPFASFTNSDATIRLGILPASDHAHTATRILSSVAILFEGLRTDLTLEVSHLLLSLCAVAPQGDFSELRT